MTDSERREFYLAVYNEEVQKQREKERKRQVKDAERIRKANEKLERAVRDIEFYTEYCKNLYPLLDIEQLEQAGAVPGSKTDIKCQRKIITLTNQIHTAEERICKAKEAKKSAEIELSA